MPCYYPLQAWYAKKRNESGKRSLVFQASESFHDRPLKLPCGQCIGCRLERSRQWAIRCVHEASMHEDNTFITLTFDQEHLNKEESLQKSDFQKFMKRLRKAFQPQKIRYFHCGEYGEKYRRPHHHACLFGFDFLDKKLWRNKNGINIYTSEILNKLWGHGYCVIGDVTFDSAAYVARYIMKKITGKESDKHYGDREKEYTTMSRRPGIGQGWYDKFKDDIYTHDKVVIRGDILCKAPKYYDSLYDIDKPEEMSKIKGIRIRKAKLNPDNTEERLNTRCTVKKSKIKQLRREYETSNI